jgi:uncharacterized protein (DUF4415 family)
VEIGTSAHIVMPRRKQTVTMRLDADLLAWFRRERGYQTRINAIPRAYMKAQDRRQPDLRTAKARRVVSNRR